MDSCFGTSNWRRKTFNDHKRRISYKSWKSSKILEEKVGFYHYFSGFAPVNVVLFSLSHSGHKLCILKKFEKQCEKGAKKRCEKK